MKGNRLKIGSEQTPFNEIIKLGIDTIEFRYLFETIPATKDEPESFDYYFVRSKDNRGAIISTIIRSLYSQDKAEAITSNYLNNDNIIEFLSFQNFRDFAKALVFNNEASANQCIFKVAYEISIPFKTTLTGGDYEEMSNRIMKLKIPFFVNQSEGKAYAYPSWVSQEDMGLLTSDPRVNIVQHSLFSYE